MTSNDKRDETESSGDAQAIKGTEADQQGGKQPAKEKAERDWQDSAKESGE